MIDGGLRKLFQARLPHIHFVSIETGGTGRGIPDTNFCVDGHEGWIEFKQTQSYRVGLRSEQVSWLLRRTRAGGRTFMAVRRKHKGGKHKGKAVDELWLYNGAEARRLSELGLNKTWAQALQMFEASPGKWDWAKIGWWLEQ